MAFSDYSFTEEEMAVDESVGFPRAYARLCHHRGSGPYGHGPPMAFIPYSLKDHEAARARELEQYFPVIDPKAKQTAKPRIFTSLLWKQLSHLGNAGFDPSVIRVDPYGNVLYYHADSASPLAWDIDHWFPCSRGGLTVPSNLRILQWQASKKKHNKLEFLIPWWDFQLGISVNQFLSIFASSNSDFRHRAFSFLFAEGENEEVNSGQTVNSHSFPQHFVESKAQLGLAPAAIVASRRDPHGSSSSILQSVDYNRLRSSSPVVAARKLRTCKENENPDFVSNPHQALVMARDSLKQREEASKILTESQSLETEVIEMRRRNEEEKFAIQDLELALIKRRRRAEKCRRLAEAQSSYKTMLEKMIRDAMHQSVVYKEQLRLNQAASSALMARLEAQKAICDASERDLHIKYKQRDELEKQIRPEFEQGRKRSRIDDTTTYVAENEKEERKNTLLLLPSSTGKPRTPFHKELRVFFEEEHTNKSASETDERLIKKSENNFSVDKRGEKEEEEKKQKIQFPIRREFENEEDEETRKERGKGNVEKWLQMLLENSGETNNENETSVITNKSDDDNIDKLNLKYPQKSPRRDQNLIRKEPEAVMIVKNGNDPEMKSVVEERRHSSVGKERKVVRSESPRCDQSLICKETEAVMIVNNGNESERKSVVEERRHSSVGKERKVVRTESSRGLRRIPSSPLIILGMKKGVDCLGKKPMVNSDDDEEESVQRSTFKKTIKKAIKI